MMRPAPVPDPRKLSGEENMDRARHQARGAFGRGRIVVMSGGLKPERPAELLPCGHTREQGAWLGCTESECRPEPIAYPGRTPYGEEDEHGPEGT
jgi:hypothetical protein